MYNFWKARKARRAATAAISPWVGRTRLRLGRIPDSAWADAYIIGFMGTLITLYAEQNAGRLGSSALASVQTGAWSDITESESILLGEEICFLSTAGDSTFQLGCCNAASFYETQRAVDAERSDMVGDVEAVLAPLLSAGEDSGSRLWARYFDAYIGRLSAPQA